MEWWVALVVIVGAVILLMVSGLPTALCFMLVNLVGVYFFWGGEQGFQQLILSIRSSVTRFSLMPIVLFMLMGSVLFHSNVAPLMINAINKWLGRLPGRLSLLAVLSGTLFATLSGSSMGSTAMLGSTLVPEMEKYGYKKPMSLGPILGSGGLAIMIPPSGLGVFVAAVAEISVGKLLIAIIVPGLMMAFLYGCYVLIRAWLQPSLAPAYDTASFSLSDKISSFIRYVLPVGFIIFLVTGLIFLGIATPSESAAVGCLGTFILAAAYRRFNWELVKKSVEASILTSVMVLFIMASAVAFSQMLAFSGASRGMVAFVLELNAPPILTVIGIQVLILIMGCFMPTNGIIMIVIPLFLPIVEAYGFDLVWFIVLTLLNTEMATTTPPFGLSLFVMKGVAPPDTEMADVYKAGLPFLGCDAIVMILLIAFPVIGLWLPGVMR